MRWIVRWVLVVAAGLVLFVASLALADTGGDGDDRPVSGINTATTTP
jgi:hypothetical protein